MKKRTLIPLLLLVALATLIIVNREWVSFDLLPEASVQEKVSVSGAAGLGGFAPIIVAILVMAVVLSIAGRVFRVGIGIAIALGGAWIAVNAFRIAVADESGMLSFGRNSIAEVTGILTDHSSGLIESVTPSIWPFVTAGLGVLLAVIGILVVVMGWRWQTGGKRYETHHDMPHKTEQNPVENDRIADWDAISGGDDPSETDDLSRGD